MSSVILIAEDEASIADAIEIYLKKSGICDPESSEWSHCLGAITKQYGGSCNHRCHDAGNGRDCPDNENQRAV